MDQGLREVVKRLREGLQDFKAEVDAKLAVLEMRTTAMEKQRAKLDDLREAMSGRRPA